METLSPKQRRAHLTQAMHYDAEVGFDCRSCVGTCCTFTSNSMQIDETQAQDMKSWLIGQNRWNDELIANLKECIEEFRLDKSVASIKIRRTYTCPFFNGDKLGCTIDPDFKPYGCLAFNPRESGVKAGGNCRSNLDLLKTSEQFVAGELLPIPIALLQLD
ncbi:MAG: hypothetical protein COW01_14120 [Bdellovibrionales bacterium CG12_big_fil_rev_8_21_14_0_65_38_15]|nr:MAG: hypothetical protein COW79_16940 [Bdellovibrionales bacterium CG22_combo_CG10-13_8_21_14_all_38_13]PIQ53409.1 MAG: hypothetical protein COW01_14120 [Bdellovibrionales bacterium CG12_big_fil_rev_8_21_14_0_65_38_15]PIR30228.1 MAG: hypothetical protein COV38_05635 [Bdellovibrionales bacterium CG11_big_fil_rev_8_21_14_0_20_38_13]